MSMQTTASDKKSVTILLAEDSEPDRDIIARALEEGRIRCNLATVEDGVEALDYLHGRGKYVTPAKHSFPDLLLLDINMPRCNGKQVLQQLRASEDKSLRRLPVIMLTTSMRDEDVMESYDLGVNAYVVKPMEPVAFIQAVRNIESFWFELVHLPGQGIDD